MQGGRAVRPLTESRNSVDYSGQQVRTEYQEIYAPIMPWRRQLAGHRLRGAILGLLVGPPFVHTDRAAFRARPLSRFSGWPNKSSTSHAFPAPEISGFPHSLSELQFAACGIYHIQRRPICANGPLMNELGRALAARMGPHMREFSTP